jgi:hypothetical protein
MEFVLKAYSAGSNHSALKFKILVLVIADTTIDNVVFLCISKGGLEIETKSSADERFRSNILFSHGGSTVRMAVMEADMALHSK